MDKKLGEDVGMIKINAVFSLEKLFLVVKFNRCSIFLISCLFRKAWPCLIWFLELYLHCEWDAGGTAFHKQIAAKWNLMVEIQIVSN